MSVDDGDAQKRLEEYRQNHHQWPTPDEIEEKLAAYAYYRYPHKAESAVRYLHERYAEEGDEWLREVVWVLSSRAQSARETIREWGPAYYRADQAEIIENCRVIVREAAKISSEEWDA